MQKTMRVSPILHPQQLQCMSGLSPMHSGPMACAECLELGAGDMGSGLVVPLVFFRKALPL